MQKCCGVLMMTGRSARFILMFTSRLILNKCEIWNEKWVKAAADPKSDGIMWIWSDHHIDVCVWVTWTDWMFVLNSSLLVSLWWTALINTTLMTTLNSLDHLETPAEGAAPSSMKTNAPGLKEELQVGTGEPLCGLCALRCVCQAAACWGCSLTGRLQTAEINTDMWEWIHMETHFYLVPLIFFWQRSLSTNQISDVCQKHQRGFEGGLVSVLAHITDTCTHLLNTSYMTAFVISNVIHYITRKVIWSEHFWISSKLNLEMFFFSL